ncbi:cold shock domain-containing protein [Neisseria canis]|uniref:Cold-shock dna-binding domain protein n=1 Tax=Neisseria canis TaxID=493 RepID=A0A448DAP3_9NEIS|nr:cold shock domain-containing protein [Neisseria canis]OSI10533.1 hypothetical protein BWD07_10595 [Neisseria canis]VEF03098.1 cold-shock dna-binding domain protein [Neisseria canis]
MKYSGKIIRWNDKRGFGFIEEEKSGTEIFAHISAFTIKEPRPIEGKKVLFKIAEDSTGKKEAVEVSYLGSTLKADQEFNSVQSRKYTNNHIVGVLLLIGVLIAIVLYFDYTKKNSSTPQPLSTVEQVAAKMAAERKQFSDSSKSAYTEQKQVILTVGGNKVYDESHTKPISIKKQSAFRCDGRVHCSQMTSCSEAEYFLEHCPNVEMDGDGDGTPCEKQWCH